MTAILCTVRDGRAYLGADSRTTTGWTYRDDAIKIIVDAPWAFAVSGSMAIASWLRFARPHQNGGEGDESYLYRLACEMAAHMESPAGKESEAGVSVLHVINRGKAWKIQVNPSHVERVNDLVGAGDPTATVAAMLVARDTLREPDAIRRAIRACVLIGPGIGGAVNVVSCGPDDFCPRDEVEND